MDSLPAQAPIDHASLMLDAPGWLAQHHRAAVLLAAFCLWISACLIGRLWLVHKNAPFFKKLFWSIVLAVPLFGWIFCGGLFQQPDCTDTPLRSSAGE
jgi:hypothetical protein